LNCRQRRNQRNNRKILFSKRPVRTEKQIDSGILLNPHQQFFDALFQTGNEVKLRRLKQFYKQFPP
jgi:hypothetical protein